MTRQLPTHSSSQPSPAPAHPPREAPSEASSAPASKAMPSRFSKSKFDPRDYTQPFISFISGNPTVFHAVEHFSAQLASEGFTALSERDLWADKLARGGKYYFSRNGSGLIAFTIGADYKPGNGAAIVASHIDALTAKVKPVSAKPTKQGFVQLGVAQYAGALNQTWFDRDLGIGGRVFVRDSKSGKVQTKLVKLDWPVARIPTIAPHFGIPAEGQANREVRMVPIIGLDNSDLFMKEEEEMMPNLAGAAGMFAATQPKRLFEVIANEIGVKDHSDITNWELEIFDFQQAQLGGLDKEFLFAGRIDDKLCSYSAIEALLLSGPEDSSIIKLVGLFDDEEIGSQLRQGAKSNFLPSTMERIVEAFAEEKSTTGTLYQTYANSFMISADVCQAYNPNYSDVYLADHTPRLNVGVAVTFDSHAHMTTDGASFALLSAVARRCDAVLQLFQIRNDGRGGGTIGPMLSAMTGVRAIDAGLPQLSMHSIRATTGALDPGLGVQLFAGLFEHFEEVDAQFAA